MHDTDRVGRLLRCMIHAKRIWSPKTTLIMPLVIAGGIQYHAARVPAGGSIMPLVMPVYRHILYLQATSGHKLEHRNSECNCWTVECNCWTVECNCKDAHLTAFFELGTSVRGEDGPSARCGILDARDGSCNITS